MRNLIVGEKRCVLLVEAVDEASILEHAAQVALHEVVVERMIEPRAATSKARRYVEQAVELADHILVRELEHHLQIRLVHIFQSILLSLLLFLF